MPIYEYACSACGHEFEEWQKITDPPVRTCPKCGKKKVEKLISHTAFQLKGGGWYSDLYSSTKPGTSGEGKSGEGKSGEGKSGEGKSEGKSGAGKSSDAKSGGGGKSSEKASGGTTASKAGSKSGKKADSRAA